jgi:hypothetical protein
VFVVERILDGPVRLRVPGRGSSFQCTTSAEFRFPIISPRAVRLGDFLPPEPADLALLFPEFEITALIGRAKGADLFLMPAAKFEGIRLDKADIYVFDEQEVTAGKKIQNLSNFLSALS